MMDIKSKAGGSMNSDLASCPLKISCGGCPGTQSCMGEERVVGALDDWVKEMSGSLQPMAHLDQAPELECGLDFAMFQNLPPLACGLTGLLMYTLLIGDCAWVWQYATMCSY